MKRTLQWCPDEPAHLKKYDGVEVELFMPPPQSGAGFAYLAVAPDGENVFVLDVGDRALLSAHNYLP